LILWREIGNTFFPYFNSVLQSPWWEPVDLFDRDFGPRNGRQWIFFPVLYSRDFRLASVTSFRDYRLAVLFVLALAAWGVSRWRNLRENPNAPSPPPDPVNEAWRVLAVFALVSYLAWLKVFGIFRYLVVLEVLSGALIVACVTYIAQRGRARIAIVAALALLLVTTTRIGWGWGRAEFGATYFDVRAPAIAPNALVIMGYSHPMAYAAPFFRSDARFVSPANNLINLGERNGLARRAEELIRGHAGPMYLLQNKLVNDHDRKTLRYFGLASDEAACTPVHSSWEPVGMRICPLAKEP
jgi:hypothetical protein